MQKGKKCFCDEPASFCITQNPIFIKFLILLGLSRLFSLLFLTSKLLEFKEFNKSISFIPFMLAGYETGYSQLISNVRSWNNC